MVFIQLGLEGAAGSSLEQHTWMDLCTDSKDVSEKITVTPRMCNFGRH